MIFVLVKDGLVEHCIADLVEFYPEHQIIAQVGEENVGWAYDGSIFTQLPG